MLKKLFGKLRLRSGYSYTSAAFRVAKQAPKRTERGVQEIFADGVAFGRALEREGKRDVKRVVRKRKW